MSKYNISHVPIKEGARDYELAASKDYLILLSSPAGANVTVKLNDNTAAEIPLLENFALECKDVSRIYINCNAVDTDEMLLFGQSATSDDFKIFTAPVVKDIQSISELATVKTVKKVNEIGSIKDIENINKLATIENFSSALISKLDKIINPYEEKTLLNYSTKNGSASEKGVLTINNCDFDEIDFLISCEDSSAGVSYCKIKLNNIEIYKQIVAYDKNLFKGNIGNNSFTLKDLRGKKLEIKEHCSIHIHAIKKMKKA